jgi:quercetin dioxygenase-like cupin family protein
VNSLSSRWERLSHRGYDADTMAAIANPIGLLTLKATSEETSGKMTAIDVVAEPGNGPPLHLHQREDEFILFLEGAFEVQLAERRFEAAPGEFVFIPRRTPHTWRAAGEAPGRFFAGFNPASPGFEELFLRYAELPAADAGPEAMARLVTETRAFEVLGPPLG